MEKHNVFKLYVVKVDDYYFICEKTNELNIYSEIFTKEKIYNINANLDEVKPLSDYYSLLVIMSYTTVQPLLLTKKELLIKYVEINSSHIERKKQHNSNYETYIKEQEEYIKALKSLAEKNPQKAKEEAIKSLQRTGILDENADLVAPYKKLLSIDESEKCIPAEHSRILVIKNN